MAGGSFSTLRSSGTCTCSCSRPHVPYLTCSVAIQHVQMLPLEDSEYQHASVLGCTHILAMQKLGKTCGMTYDYRLTRPQLRQLYFRSGPASIALMLCTTSCPILGTDLKLRHTLPSGEHNSQTPLSCCCTTGGYHCLPSLQLRLECCSLQNGRCSQYFNVGFQAPLSQLACRRHAQLGRCAQAKLPAAGHRYGRWPGGIDDVCPDYCCLEVYV